MNKIENKLNNFFDAITYSPTYDPPLLERNDIQIEFLASKIVGSKENIKILDLHCGPGRHVAYFHKEGYIIEALDMQKHFLEKIERDNPGILTYCCNSINFRKPNYYTHVYCMETAIGYQSKEDDMKIFTNIYDSLCSSGLFILHVQNREITYKYFSEEGKWQDANGQVVKEIRELDLLKGTIKLIQYRNNLIDQEKNITEIEVYFYSASELISMAESAGFSLLEAYGDFNESSYSMDSPELILILRK